MNYPDRHHPVFFVQDALVAQGADAVFNGRDERTEGCWGLIVNGKPFVWLIDNRWPHESEHEDPAAARLLERGALVCCAQKLDAERIGARWLPLAVSPGYRTPDRPVEKTADVAFVGYIRDMGRAALLNDVAARFTLFTGQGLFGDNAVEAYWSARVGLNAPTQYGNPLAYDAPMRVFEILATGTPLVTNALPELPALGLEDGITCATYQSGDDVIQVIRRLVDNPDLAQQIGANGAALAAERHTYQHRAKQILEWLA